MNILIPLEGMATEDLVLPFCRELPGLLEGSIALLQVVTAQSPAERLEEEANAAAHLVHAERAFFGLCHEIRAIVRVGDPAHEIVAAADELGVDLIVMHIRPPQYRERTHRPSVTERVLSQAHRPVVALHDDSRHPKSALYGRVALGLGKDLKSA
jgi:nucleotide-binding universal stress UspA family protein